MIRPGMLRGLVCAVALAGAIVVAPACAVGVGPVYAGFPDGCIATTEPVYWGGYANYWCGGAWYFRGADGRWGYYGRGPGGLRGRLGGGRRN